MVAIVRRAVVLCAWLFAFASFAEDARVRVNVRAILIDAQLNQKPVPRMVVTITREGSAEPITVRTDFDGTSSIELVPGTYRFEVATPVRFEDQQLTWSQVVNVTGPTTVDFSNDNATVVRIEKSEGRKIDELSALFASLKNSVFTVWSEFGHGTGFLVDEAGLILTNAHVVDGSALLSVQFDPDRKVRAELVASDGQRDVAVLRIRRDAFPDAIVAPIANVSATEAGVVEGERVFTIGSPLNQRKILTSGVVSKVEARAILSDVNINHGNSGGPLFNSLGEAVGITTFGDIDPGLAGVSGIVRIHEALPLLADARSKAAGEPPSADLLPVDPKEPFPIDAIRKAVVAEKFPTRPYSFSAGGYDVTLITPVLRYRMELQAQMESVKNKQRRNRKSAQAVQNTIQPMEHLRNWAEYVGEYRPVLLIEARPQLREGFWSAFGRGLAASQGIYAGPANLAFRTDFYRMKLKCGSREVPPIHPGKNPIVLNAENFAVRVKDATYSGFYAYPPDAISPACGTVVLQLFSEKAPETAVNEVLSPQTVNRIWADFEAYRAKVTGTAAPAQ
jgi:S1-C subfamily serine protease